MRIYVKVLPRSSRNSVELAADGSYKVKLTAPPVNGAANEMLRQVLAKHFGVAKSAISIVGGKTAKTKLVEIG